MRAVVQRVSQASVSVEGKVVGAIGRGVVVLAGVTHSDTEEQAEWLARKIAGLRIFEDREGKMNAGLLDVEGAALVISQFTLYADARKGRRPGFTDAALPEVAEPPQATSRAAQVLGARSSPSADITGARSSIAGGLRGRPMGAEVRRGLHSYREALDMLLDDEALLERAYSPLLDVARRREVSPAAAEGIVGLLLAWQRTRRIRRAVEAEVAP